MTRKPYACSLEKKNQTNRRRIGQGAIYNLGNLSQKLMNMEDMGTISIQLKSNNS